MHRSSPLVLTALLVLLGMTPAALAGHDAAPNTLRLGLGGYSPVSYFERDRPHVGSPQHRADHDGVTYFFADAAEKRAFLADPARFVPAYGGWCAYGMAVEGVFDADPTNYEIVNGRLNVFLRNDEVDTRELWNQGDASELRSNADAFWGSLNQPASRAYAGSRNLPAHGVALEGYSPVSYFTVGRAERGDARFAVEHDGVTYHLTSAEQVAAFNKNPDRYAPQYGGWCAFGMSVQDKFPVDPTAFEVIDDKLYVFLRNEQIDARALWNAGDQTALLAKSEAHWKKVSGQ